MPFYRDPVDADTIRDTRSNSHAKPNSHTYTCPNRHPNPHTDGDFLADTDT